MTKFNNAKKQPGNKPAKQKQVPTFDLKCHSI